MKLRLTIGILLVCSKLSAQLDINLTGIWQDASVLGSGWSDNFQIFEDGKIIHNFNQMNCADSLISEVGQYRLRRNRLIITYHELNYLQGGRLIPATGSCGGDFELVDGTQVSKSLKKQIKLRISEPELIDSDTPNRETIMIGTIQYWKMVYDPEEYN